MCKKNIKIFFISFVVLLTFFVQWNSCASFGADNKTQIERKRAQAKKEIHKLKLLEKIETNKLYRNQKKLEQTEVDLMYNRQQYIEALGELHNLQSQYSAARENYHMQQRATNKRIVQIYKTKRMNYVEFLLSATSPNEFLDRIYFENIIMGMDKEKIAQTQARTRKLAELADKVENQKRYLESSKHLMDRQQRNIQGDISRNEKMIYRLKTDRATWERSERELARQSKQIEVMINKTVRAESSTTLIKTTGGFVRPVNGRVTSPYGYRMHPIFKRKIYHAGADIGMPYGANVRAANSGKVIYTGWYGGYGKVVILDHGRVNGVPLTTLYAHLSSYRVSTGSSVYKGQVIANVGSTGYSTGPHLHFEVRRNGTPTNPFNYVPR